MIDEENISRWASAFNKHPVHDALDIAEDYLKVSPKIPDAKQEAELYRLKGVFHNLREILLGIDSDCYPKIYLDQIDSDLREKNFLRNLNRYSTDQTSNHLVAVNNHIDRIIPKMYTIAGMSRQVESQQVISSAHNAFASFTSLIDNKVTGIDDRTTRFLKRGLKGYQSLRSDLVKTKTFYENEIPLLSAVNYWNSKSHEHHIALSGDDEWYNWGLNKIVPIYFLATAIVVGFFVFWFAVPQMSQTTATTEVKLIYSSFSLLITSLFLWGGRLLTRVWLSHRHLKADAIERRVMIETYMALAKEGQVSPEDRVLVLGSIFRHGSDGMIKDDASPDIAAAAMIGRLIK